MLQALFSLTQRRGEAENAEVHWVDRVVSFSVIVSIFLSALSASPHLCVRSPPPRATAIKYFGTFHTISEKLVFDDIDASIARQKT